MTKISGASLVIGSTGLIGKKLIFELAKKDSKVIAIARRSISNLPENVSLLDINFDDFLENGSLPSCDHIYICLGTTIKKAGSQSEFKKVDFDYCVSFAKKAREAGATKISLVSSVGANPYAKNFYLKMTISCRFLVHERRRQTRQMQLNQFPRKKEKLKV